VSKNPILIPRSPWTPEFPEVIIHSVLKARDTHPSYAGAKSGDAEAAKAIVEDLLSPEETEHLRKLVAGQCPYLLAVTADEVSGFNAIPDAMAQALAERLSLAVVAGTIIQANKVGHTRADGWHRLVTPAVFEGEVVEGAGYLLVDDHVGFGGTLANLRGFIEAKGGHVIGMTTLTETRAARQIAVRKETLDMLKGKHGAELEQFWSREFGHGVECLTDIEAGYLCRAESVATIKARMAQAAEFARGRGLSPVNLSTTPSIGEPS
jgi:hypothetical protein